jgi:signal peptidase I
MLIVLTTLVLTVLLIGPAMFLLGGKIFKIEGADFKRAFITNLAIVGLGVLLLLVQLGLLLLGLGYGLISILNLLALLVLGTWIIKKLFKTTIPRSLGVYVIAALLSLVFSFFVSMLGFRAYLIPKNSMVPALIQGDHVFVDKLVYRFKEPERGDLMVFRAKNGKHHFVKRLIGMPGEEIEIREGKVYVNNTVIKETLVLKETTADGETKPLENYGPIKIPGESFFVLGDNSKYSYDSRHFGFVSRAAVIGRVDTIYWSINRETKRIRWERILKRVK